MAYHIPAGDENRRMPERGNVGAWRDRHGKVGTNGVEVNGNYYQAIAKADAPQDIHWCPRCWMSIIELKRCQVNARKLEKNGLR